MPFDMRAAIDEVADIAPSAVAPVPMVPGLQLHVDGDYLAYYASGNDETTQGTARQNALDLIAIFRSRTGADTVIVHNTAKGCQKGERYLIATVKPYQAQRADGRKPKNQPYLQDWLMQYEGPHFTVKNWATREADDGIGACAHYAIGKTPGYVAIATADKDLRMLPGLHVDWKNFHLTRVHPGAYEVIGEDGKLFGTKWFWMQMLTGDTADHIPGLPGFLTNAKTHKGTFKPAEEYDGDADMFKPIGEKTAEKFLAGTTSNAEAYAIVAQLYRGFYRNHPQYASCWYDRFCEQAALLWMRCDTNASVCDFATHMGHSRISGTFCNDMLAAVKRLEERVKDQRSSLDALAGSAG